MAERILYLVLSSLREDLSIVGQLHERENNRHP